MNTSLQNTSYTMPIETQDKTPMPEYYDDENKVVNPDEQSDEYFDSQPNTNRHDLHRPAGVDELTDEEITADVSARVLAIRECEAPNAYTLKPGPNSTLRFRLLQFGNPHRVISLSARHIVFAHGVRGCPKWTQAELGGDKTRRCPLCDALRLQVFSGRLRPVHVTHMWGYVIVLGRGTGPNLDSVDPEFIEKPYRLQFELEAKGQIYRLVKENLLIGDIDQGLELELKVSNRGVWDVRPIQAGPIQLSNIPHVRRRQLHRINRWLGDPHMWTERNPKEGFEPKTSTQHLVASDEQLIKAYQHLLAHQNHPQRWDDQFWSQMMEGSRPDLVRE